MIYNKQFSPVFGMIWQILRIKQIHDMNIKNIPGIIKLKKAEESVEDFYALKTEDFLIRWVNYHMEKGGHSDRISNLNKDLESLDIYTLLIDQLGKNKNTIIDRNKVLNIKDEMDKA